MLGTFVDQLSGRDEKMQKLRSNIEALAARATDIKTEVEDAEVRTRKKRKHEVENWLGNIEKMKNKVRNLEQEVEERKISPLFLGKSVDKLNAEIAELRELGNFQGDLILDVCETRGEPLLPTKLTGRAVKQNLKNIWACLMADKVFRIGICGMGGVGKTSLAVFIHSELRANPETCDHVLWCTISKDHDYSIGKLQSDIAKCLKFDLSNEKDEKKRAAELSEALTRRKRCVLFLDDVWNKIDLHKVGIPDGCKLILTTRSVDVCRKMGCKEFKVVPLSRKEAWNLFWEKLSNGEDTTFSPEVIDTAKSVAAECDGLPLGIITMAGSMRGVDDIREWRNLLEELKKLTMGHEDMEKDVLPILKLSYSRLNDIRLQHCFLHCSLYPEDWEIERRELIGHFIAEGLIDERKSWQAKFDEGHTMLNKLERSCLLESCKDYRGNECVKMHDLIRDMAIKITTASHPRFMVKAGVGLNEIPDEQEWTKDLDKISLMKNKIENIPQGRLPRCPRLSTLILRENPLMRVVDSFFEHMHALQVLDLRKTAIVELPNSISNLENLTALLLGGCWQLTYVPHLGNLTALQELDLSFTAIKELPQGVDKLVNLKILNMEWTQMQKMIPRGTLGRLSHLQHVKLGCTLGPVDIQAEESDGLTELEVIEVIVGNVQCFNRFVKFLNRRNRCGPQLEKCSLELVGRDPYIFIYEEEDEINYDSSVKLGGYIFNKEEYAILVPGDIEFLKIKKCSFASSCSLCDVFPSLNDNLWACEIKECEGIECIVSLEREATYDEDQLGETCCVGVPFQSLWNLEISCMSDLRALFWPNKLGLGVIAPPRGTFSSLKVLEIHACHKVNSVCTLGLLLRHLQNLEMITIDSCDKMKEIFDDDEGMGTSFCINNDDNNHNTTTPITLPKLEYLYLHNLPKLKSICRREMICKSIEEIVIRSCPKLKTLPFSLPLDNREQPFAPKALNTTTPITLPKLKNLGLHNLPELMSICEREMICESIEVIDVGCCPKLKRLPFSLPLDNEGQPSAPKALKKIEIDNHMGWWESLEWDHPSIKDVLLPFVHFEKKNRGDYDDDMMKIKMRMRGDYDDDTMKMKRRMIGMKKMKYMMMTKNKNLMDNIINKCGNIGKNHDTC